MDYDSVFEAACFIDKYKQETVDFYRRYFNSEDEMLSFFVLVFSSDANMDCIPRMMMNRVKRLVSLAIDIVKIKVGADALQVVFFQTCIEALYKLRNKPDEKRDRFFLDYCTPADQKYIIDNFELVAISADKTDDNASSSTDSPDQVIYVDMELTLFADLLSEIRTIALHEGDYWSIHTFNSEKDSWLITGVTSQKKSIKKKIKKIYTTYSDSITGGIFNILDCTDNTHYAIKTTLDFQQFTFIFVKAGIKFITDYIG